MTSPTQPVVMRVRIKEGTLIFQDHHSSEWPYCFPPKSEYEGEEYQHIAKNPDMEFDGEWNGRCWYCKADGYGYLKSCGDIGEYGNGGIFVTGLDGVEILNA